MCCLFGLIDTRHSLSGKEKSKFLHILASESEARGTDATGIAYNVGKQLCIHKRPIPGHKLQIRVRDDTVAVMGHTRMTTLSRAEWGKLPLPWHITVLCSMTSSCAALWNFQKPKSRPIPILPSSF